MKTLEDIILRLDQMDSLMFSIEDAMLAAAENGGNDTKKLHNLVYILWEQLQQVTKEATELNGHIEVCNAVYAVHRVEELKNELAELKKDA